MGGESIPPYQGPSQGRDHRSIGRGYAKKRDDGGRDPEQRAKAARSKDGTHDGRRDVKREVGRSKELLDAKDVRGDRAERGENCSGRRVSRDSARSLRFVKGNFP